LQQYTQEAMDLYAKNFKLKSGKELGEGDLVWAAVIH
jgi:DNA polymerase I-like protein with 3'-5' exonuclease and polymerase domains